MTTKQKDLNLLPAKFKKLAYSILGLSIIVTVLSISGIVGLDKAVTKEIFISSLLLSLTLLAITKDKDEDELTIKLRFKAYTAAFLFGSVSVIIEPVINLVFESSSSYKDVFALLISMHIVYFFMYYILKKSR
ncbi:hypothetical protein [Penaeicola halotolerans]|uniref:hypothetical protein n=1 Tax=Penaeicola halotolerans TaxID=2793196 RepID=UPI001CF87638|nr:hypothetical protein [Penaeicola halotolerans]